MAIRTAATSVVRQLKSFRTAGVLVTCAVAVLVAPTLAAAAPHSSPHTRPTTADVQRQLGELALKNTQLVEQYNQARVVATRMAKSAKVARSAATRASGEYDSARAVYVNLIQDRYEGSGSFGAAGALLQSSSDANYVNRMSSLNLVSDHVSQVVASVNAIRSTSVATATKAEKLAQAASAHRNALGKQRATVTAQIAKYKSVLATLNTVQRAAYQRTQYPTIDASKVHFPKADSAAAAKAVQFALDQLGKPYVFGAAGPGSYDCSGLTMAAWASAGISLPHSAADQYNYGTHIPEADLQPGDLLFYYQPIGHVTIYAGSGMMVSAPTEGEPVTLVPVAQYDGDFVGATRLTK